VTSCNGAGLGFCQDSGKNGKLP